MIFFSFIILFFKSFIFLIENILVKNLFALEIAFCWFVWVALLAYKLKNTFNLSIKETYINLHQYKLHRPKLSVIFVLLYLICFISTLFLFKISRRAREISLKQLYIELFQFFSNLDLGQKVCTILFGLTLVYLAILLSKKVKNLIFKEIIKVHLYYCINIKYLDLVCFPITLHSHMNLENAVKSFFRSKINFLKGKNWFHKLIQFLVEHLVLILILLFVSFDIWFNDFVLTKVFYILPPCFLYSQYLYMSKFYTSKEIFLDEFIYKYLYTKIFFEDENLIIFEDGSEIDSEIRLILDNYIKKDFRAYNV